MTMDTKTAHNQNAACTKPLFPVFCIIPEQCFPMLSSIQTGVWQWIDHPRRRVLVQSNRNCEHCRYSVSAAACKLQHTHSMGERMFVRVNLCLLTLKIMGELIKGRPGTKAAQPNMHFFSVSAFLTFTTLARTLAVQSDGYYSLLTF
jgi:hypothetical protein